MRNWRRLASALVLMAFLAPVTFFFFSCGESQRQTGLKVLILGIDGMDPLLLQEFMAKGVMPNFSRLVEEGSFLPLQSSTPPQSPVAWSNFITGANPGRHGIYDFIHRDPAKYMPYLSTSESKDPDPKYALRFGSRLLWLRSGTTRLLRQGTPFWEYLARAGVWQRVFKIPSNFPPAEGKGWSGSGMGTPDILGTYGTFTWFTDFPPEHSEPIGGGTIEVVDTSTGVVRTWLRGPPNLFKLDPVRPIVTWRDEDGQEHKRYRYEESRVPLTIYLDAEHPAVKIEWEDAEVLLQEGEWSGWYPITFKLWPPVAEVKGIVRFYLKQVRPHLKLYASPINMDPHDPSLPLTNPPEYSRQLAADVGYYYTQGMPENTKARQADLDIFNDAELFHQMMLVHEEDRALLRWHLDRFHDGLLFYYFGTLDLGTHMFWRLHDPSHPAYDPEWAQRLGDPLQTLYEKMDAILGMALEALRDPATGHLPENTTLIVMSDHGFASWSRSFNLNTWLWQNGYLVLKEGVKPEEVEYFLDKNTGDYAVDWSRTQAYGLGLNGLYINLQGRELYGAVPPSEKNALVDELAARLAEFVDPETGEHPLKDITKSYVYYHGPAADIAPDIVVGFKRGYRGGDDSALGEIPTDIITLNKSSWSGDHCIAASEVPGVILSNKKITKPDPALIDLAPTVLKIFGLEIPAEMEGRPLF